MPSAIPDPPLDQAALLAALRARVARLEGGSQARHATGAILVCEGLPLPSGGLARAALHEVWPPHPGAVPPSAPCCWLALVAPCSGSPPSETGCWLGRRGWPASACRRRSWC